MSETDKLVERLDRPSTPEGFEEIMKAWDRIRHVLQVEKNRGSYPRDMFETLIDGLAQDMRQAAVALRSAEARIRELEEELRLYSEAGRHDTLKDAEVVTTLEAQLARAKEVLEPFAKWGAYYDPGKPGVGRRPGASEYRAAASFLASIGGKE